MFLAPYRQSLNPYVRSYRHMFDVLRSSGSNGREISFHFATSRTPDPRRYNAPAASSEVAVVYGGDRPQIPGLMIYPFPQENNAFTHRASFLSNHVDPLCYPLLFLDGQHGWHPQLRAVGAPDTKISACEFFSHRLMQRQPLPPFVSSPARGTPTSTESQRPTAPSTSKMTGPRPSCDTPPAQSGYQLPHAVGRLFHQYCVDAYCRIEAERMSFYNKPHAEETSHHEPSRIRRFHPRRGRPSNDKEHTNLSCGSVP